MSSGKEGLFKKSSGNRAYLRPEKEVSLRDSCAGVSWVGRTDFTGV